MCDTTTASVRHRECVFVGNITATDLVIEPLLECVAPWELANLAALVRLQVRRPRFRLCIDIVVSVL